MKKTLLPILLLLAFTACNERKLSTVPAPALPVATMHVEATVAPTVEAMAEPEVESNIDTIKKPEVSNTNTTINSSPSIPIPVATTTVPPITEAQIEPKIAPKVQTHAKSNVQTFAGGTVTDGLDLGMIRLGKEGTSTRLVFDSFKWNIATKTPSVRTYESGYYTFSYNPQNRRITAVINGYRAFSALQAGKARLFSSAMVQKVYLEKYLDDSGFKFTIQLKQNAKVNVFDLTSPGRIIVDISPI